MVLVQLQVRDIDGVELVFHNLVKDLSEFGRELLRGLASELLFVFLRAIFLERVDTNLLKVVYTARRRLKLRARAYATLALKVNADLVRLLGSSPGSSLARTWKTLRICLLVSFTFAISVVNVLQGCLVVKRSDDHAVLLQDWDQLLHRVVQRVFLGPLASIYSETNHFVPMRVSI